MPPLAVLVVLLLWPVIGFGARQAWLSSKNRIEDWLPASFPETKALFSFFDRFGSDEFLMISWQDCVLEDTRAEKLEELLLKPAPDGQVYFAKADSGQRVLDALTARQNISDAEARKRLTGLFVGKDGRQTCVIALISPSGFEDRKAAIAWAWQASLQATGLPREDIHLAGTTADSIAVDEASNAHLLELNAMSSIVCFLILAIALQKFWLVGTIFLTAVLNQQLALAVIYFTGGHVDSVQLLVANLCFVLTISAGLHYLGYFREAVREGRHSPALAAVRQAFIPTVLAAVTTSLGLISLCVSEIIPIRSFGFYAAILVPVNTAVVVSLLTIHATWASRRNWKFQLLLPESDSHQSIANNRWATYLVPLLKRKPLTLVVLWLLIMLAAGWGSTRLNASVGTHKLLAADSKLIRDYAWLENHIGPLVPIELVLRFPKGQEIDAATTFSRLQAVDHMRQRLSTIPEVESTFSALTFLPPLPTGSGIGNTMRRSAIGKIAHESQSRFGEMRLFYEDNHEQCWRLSGRVAGSKTANYEVILNRLQHLIDEFQTLPKYAAVTVDISGGIPFVYRTQRQLLTDLLSSFSSAFVMIAVSMSLLFRSIAAGLLLMIPNVTPAAIVFGIMGWLNMEVELGTVLTASVMMGVCVDDTLHLITHFRMLRRQGLEHTEAVSAALANSGGAMLQTALVCGLGMLVFALSSFTPIARFAWLTFTLLTIGAISDLILTPAILLSPLHRVFYWPSNKTSQADASPVPLTGESA